MRNHLVIGLGGTGGRVIRSLRKRVFHEQRSNEIPGLSLEYLYIDSSGELMNPSDPSWKTLGVSVQLAPGNQLRIAGANLREIINDIRNYPTIQPWIGSAELWKKVPSDIITSGAGGQRRRLGRFLFAMKAREFRQKIEALSRNMEARTQSNANTFHVIAGLAGGTGSGSIVDVISQIAAFSPGGQQDRIVVYAVLPDRVPGPGWDAGNYHANGYAALVELNGLMIRRYQPWDVLDGKGTVEVGDRLKGVYVITNENENGFVVSMEQELPGIVADFLYEVISESNQAKPPTQTLENFSGDPECVPGTNEPMRARRFSSFGLKRVAVPEEEINEYLTLSFSRQAVLQLYYNNWDDRLGYREQLQPRNFTSIVNEADLQKRWMLTDAHLRLELPILSQDVDKAKQWNPSIDAEWNSIQAWVEPDCVEQPREVRLNELHNRYEDMFARVYRGRGVAAFYSEATAGCRKMATHIVNTIERECFAKWQEGTYAAREIGEILDALRDQLEQRKQRFEARKATLQEEIEAYNQEITSLREQWSDLGMATFLFKWKSIYGQFSNACRDHFRAMTEAAATDFATSLIPQIIDALAGLKESVNQVTARFEAALKDFRESLEARVTDVGAKDFRDVIVRYYDPKSVRETVERLVTNPVAQKQQASVVRKVLVDEKRLGGEQTFERFRERVAAVDLLDVIERTCAEQARIAHDTLVQNDRERILGVQLMQRLRDEYGSSEEKLQEFARDLIQPAKTFVRFDQAQVRMDKAQVGAPEVGGDAQRAMIVKRPCPDELRDFVTRLDGALTRVDLDVRKPDDNSGRPHELTVLSFMGNFPLRYLEILKLLRERYRRLLDGSASSLAKLELHTDDAAANLPDLFPEVGAPKDSLAYILLGLELGVIRQEEDPVSGEAVIIARVGKGALKEPLRIGKTLSQAEADLTPAHFLAIRGEIDQRIAAEHQHLEARKKLAAGLEQQLASKKDTLKGGDLHPEYQRYREAVVRAETILNVG